MDNTLYYGDNLEILKRYDKYESVDLVYLDPPFNSNQNFNALFKEMDGTKAARRRPRGRCPSRSMTSAAGMGP
jgi:DNA modification methylase